jgi:beta-galactosidase GanA
MKLPAITSLLLALTAPASAAAATPAPAAATPAVEKTGIPHLRPNERGAQLYVEGRPFFIRGGELGNSAAATLEWVKPLFPRLAAMNLNTVLVPVSWELIEPREGKWSFDLVGGLVREARRHRLRVILLWFGSWKNGMSSYAPAWVKSDQRRFPRAEIKPGRPVEALSAFSPANLEADRRAFVALMRYVRQIDQRQHTVIMVQVENEVAMIDESADRSAAASAAFRAPVPRLLVDHLVKHRATLEPTLTRAWAQNGSRTSGSWEELFGRGAATEELFMAWHYARYVEEVTRAGKAEYPLPMLTNAALNRPGRLPGQYPTGGPLPHLFDIWKAAAPSLDFLAPDIYLPGFTDWCDRYARPGNPLFVPEAQNDVDAAIYALYLAGRSALGFSPFAIESAAAPAAAALTTAYGLLARVEPALHASRAGAKTASTGVVLEKERPTMKLTLGDHSLSVAHDYTFAWASPARHEPTWPRAGGLVIATGPDEYVVVGNGLIITFAPSSPGDRMAGIESIDEGRYENGRFVVTRRLNGDETHQGRHLRLPMGAFGLQRVKLYRYQ